MVNPFAENTLEHQLCRLCDVLEVLATRLPARLELELPDLNPPCHHPESARIWFGGMGSTVSDWECSIFKGGCGQRYMAAEAAESA